mmetsp:Transcript_14496/g.30414  ORF Transcript_14496/g.30414 Transcript_14496/m.30414 type:complete len:100 (-) Transcript_14496:85-384(-)
MAGAKVLPALLAGVFCVVLLRGALQPQAFLSPRADVAAPAQRPVASLAAAVPAVAAAVAPELASAATEQELNRFGFAFAIFFLVFFFAAFARLLSIGRL